MSLKKISMTAAAVVMAFSSAASFADTDIGLITFDGAVTDTTCVINTNNGEDTNNITITLPVVKKSDVEGTTIDKGVGSKNFELMLTKCPAQVKKASAVFMSKNMGSIGNGTIDPDSNVSGSATNVSLAMFNNSSSNTDRVMVGQPANNSQVADVTNGSGNLYYRVAYVPGSAWVKDSNPVTAGKVTANAFFTMSYE
ncbi:fimbrial protein [Enterobacter sp. RHBSTW-00994]|uniref:fimbrial protein n=1 Tax=Enterobacter sp. RHBSTW-00994 TaxID=2742676 RepID=UPI0015E9CC67|nr:fimbrial protein [Enterobacter sp. RHBSTW-00994]QLR41879.1 fimbrial protein [Enterobacter sp. RHBSTW-00994]